MSVGKTVLQGSTVEKNGLPPRASNPAVTLKGTFHGSRGTAAWESSSVPYSAAPPLAYSP